MVYKLKNLPEVGNSYYIGNPTFYLDSNVMGLLCPRTSMYRISLSALVDDLRTYYTNLEAGELEFYRNMLS